jgi:hypothetical protein
MLFLASFVDNQAVAYCLSTDPPGSTQKAEFHGNAPSFIVGHIGHRNRRRRHLPYPAGGFFRGAFTSQLTASIAADDVLFATDMVATSEETAMGRQLIASAH